MSTVTRAPEAPATSPTRGGTLTGTGTLVRFLLRRDRVRIPVWVAGLAVTTVATAGSFVGIYPTAADRQLIAETLETPAMVALSGVNPAPDSYTFGAMMTHQMLWFTAVVAAVMSVLLLVRHTRVEEATGRAELVRANVVGRHAVTTAALITVAIANLAVAAAMAVGLAASGIESITWQGSLLYGAAHAAVGLVFAGVAAVTVQLTEHPRAASGFAIAAIGVAYGLRAVGDLGEGVLSWLSPIGWAQATRAYVDDRWWPLLLALAVAGGLVATSFALSARRDVGAGLRRPRPGPATASAALATPLGLAFRLHRASLLGWAIGLFLLGATYGSVLGEAEQMLADIEALQGILPEEAGVSLIEAFAGMITSVIAIIASGYAISAALKLRSEEGAGRADPLLATALSRTRWAAGHLAVAALGGTAVLLAAGVGMGAAGAASTGQDGLLADLVVAALAYAPALWVAIGLAALLFGALPRAVPAVWAVVVYGFVVVYLGPLLELPDWLQDLSPFGHVPQLPVEDLAAAPLAVLTGLAAALVAGGLLAFRRRDVQSAT